MKPRWMWGLLPVLVGGLAQAQILGTGVIPVYEVGAQLFQNTVTAIQSTISAVEDVVQTATALENMVPLDVIVVVEGIQEDLAALGMIMQQAEQLQYDIASIQAQLDSLFNLDLAPTGTTELQLRLMEIRRYRQQQWSYVIRLQTLGRTVMRTIDHLGQLLTSISAFLGNKQGQQSLAQINATMSKTQAIQAVQIAAYQQAGGFDKLEEIVTIDALHKINAETMADWPVR